MHNPRCPRCEQLCCGHCGTRKEIRSFTWRGKVGLTCWSCAELLVEALDWEYSGDVFELLQHHCDTTLAHATVGLQFFEGHGFEFISRNITINDAFLLVDEE